MTRETKIGLLVGLAFILIVGILLSEHVTRSTEPPQATLVTAGSTVREGVNTPGGTAVQPPITPITAEQVQPRQPVPTQQELRQSPTPLNQVVQVATPTTPAGTGGPAASPVTPAIVRPSPEPAFGATEPGAGSSNATTPVPSAPVAASGGAVQPEPSPWDALAGIAASQGEPLVAVNSPGHPQSTSATPLRIETPPPAPVGTREYIAEPGDNLHKIALKTMGASTKANRDAIVRLNPSLQKSADRIIVGQRYLVPAVPGLPAATTASRGSSQPANGTSPAGGNASPQRTATEPARAAESQYIIYEVKPGDSLWRIAVNHTGSPAGIKIIRDLNPDVLTSDAVRVGMKLKLPKPPAGQATARAN